MLKSSQSLAIYLSGHLLGTQAKMGYGVLRYSQNPIACAIDPEYAGRALRDVLPWVRQDCPVVADVASARALGAEVLVLGLAPLGGRLPVAWMPDIEAALQAGMCVINGLHERVGPWSSKLAPGQWIWDIRQEPAGLLNATGAAMKLDNRRVLMIGTDMAVGKMTAGLELHAAALRRGLDATFVATGQIGITITGRGVPLDAIRLDFASGAIEREVLAARGEVCFVEGQGSLIHPSSSATLPLLRGSCPTHMVLCHRAGMQTLKDATWVRIPPLRDVIALYEALASTCGTFPAAKVVGVVLNTGHLDAGAARAAVDACADDLSLPATDVVRFGADNVLDGCLA